MNGKGSRQRPCNQTTFDANFERIFGGNKMLISIEYDEPKHGVEVLITKLKGVGRLNRKSRVAIFEKGVDVKSVMAIDNYTHWMYVPEVGE